MIGNLHLPRAAHLLNGKRAEKLALHYLKAHGLVAVEQNYHCRRGEIDLVMRDAGNLVFVEVRYRASENFGTPAETIQQNKIARLRYAAEHYLQRTTCYSGCYSRFDVIAISGPLDAPDINWIKDAF